MRRENSQPLTEGPDTVIMSVKLRSGRFESSIECPLFASPAEKEEFIGAWLKLMEAGLKIGSAGQSARAGEQP